MIIIKDMYTISDMALYPVPIIGRMYTQKMNEIKKITIMSAADISHFLFIISMYAFARYLYGVKVLKKREKDKE